MKQKQNMEKMQINEDANTQICKSSSRQADKQIETPAREHRNTRTINQANKQANRQTNKQTVNEQTGQRTHKQAIGQTTNVQTTKHTGGQASNPMNKQATRHTNT